MHLILCLQYTSKLDTFLTFLYFSSNTFIKATVFVDFSPLLKNTALSFGALLMLNLFFLFRDTKFINASAMTRIKARDKNLAVVFLCQLNTAL